MSIKGNVVGTPMPRSDWSESNPNKASYIRNKPKIIGNPGAGENAEVFNGWVADNAQGDCSHAEGAGAIAGARGFYIKAIDTANRKLYLTTESCIPVFDVFEADESLPKLTAYLDQTICVEANGYYQWPMCAVITAVEAGGILTYDRNVAWDAGSSDMTPFALFAPDAPLAGAVSMGSAAHAEGSNTLAAATETHAEGCNTKAVGRYAHAEGSNTLAGYTAHAEGMSTEASGFYAHAEGWGTKALATAAHAEGYITIANGQYSHAEGQNSKASGTAAHAEGRNNVASGLYSHAEGLSTQATAERAHAEGIGTVASANDAHAEGFKTQATAQGAHSEGRETIAGSKWQHVQGKFNVEDTEEKYAHIVGNGSSTAHSNAHTLDWKGNAWYAGTVEATALILSSPNGTRFKITVDNNGSLKAVQL